MQLGAILADLPPNLGARLVAGTPDTEIAEVCDDSRDAVAGALFLAVTGSTRDGRDFIPGALERGATALLIEESDAAIGGDLVAALRADPRLAVALARGVAMVAVADGRSAQAEIPFIFQGRPDRRLRIVGVTGTNGKTTTASLVRQIAQGCGLSAAELGTVGLLRPGGDAYEPVGNTTPGPVRLARLFRELADAGTDVLAMEVSSHAIAQRRVAAVRFAAAAFTNVTHDHLDYHGSFEEYAAVKTGWLHAVTRQTVPGAAVVNVDDAEGRRAAEALRAAGAPLVTYATARHRRPDILAERPRPVPGGMRAVWRIGDQVVDHTLSLAGVFNVANAMAAVGAAQALGLQAGEALRELSWVSAPPGRFERIDAGQKFTALVDYAHTPDALENVLTNARAILDGMRAAAEARTGDPAPERNPPKLIVVFGAGGDRDRAKRPKMGEVCARLADVAIVTSDNPRREDPLSIIAEVRAGVPPERAERVAEEPDRRLAIREAVARARRGDVLVVAGKGHEDYQEIGDERHPFDDRIELRAALEARPAEEGTPADRPA